MNARGGEGERRTWTFPGFKTKPGAMQCAITITLEVALFFAYALFPGV
jgi:hypothetical protein